MTEKIRYNFVSLISRNFLQALQKSGNITKLEDILKEEVDPGIPEIKHFMYKSKTTAQFLTSCDKSYEDLEKKKRLKNIYFVLKKRLLSLNRPVKLLYFSGSHESAIAWVRKFLWKCFTKFFFHIWFFSGNDPFWSLCNIWSHHGEKWCVCSCQQIDQMGKKRRK